MSRRAAIPSTRRTFGHVLDDVIFAAFPGWGLRRKSLRAAGELVERRRARFGVSLAADTDSARGRNWLASKLSPDAILDADLVTMRERSRDLFRDNGYYAGAVEGRTVNVIGVGITPQAEATPLAGRLTPRQAQDVNASLEQLFGEWSRSAGVAGDTLWELQRLAEREQALGGDCQIIVSDLPRPETPLPLALEILAPERLATPPAKAADIRTRLGIERDRYGRPVRYWFRRDHPGDASAGAEEYQPIDAERVYHVYDRAQAEQGRGFPWCRPIAQALHDLKDFTEAELISQQVAACFAVFIKTAADPYAAAVGSASETVGTKRLQDLQPGLVHYLGQNEETSFASPTRPGGAFAPFTEFILRAIGAGLNYPYELLAKDYSKTTYSSARVSLIDARLWFRDRQQLLIQRWLLPLWQRFVDQAVLLDLIDLDPVLYATHRAQLAAVRWVPSGWPWIDPLKDIQASIQAIDQNLSTVARETAAVGGDWESIFAQRAREVAAARALGITPAPLPGAPAAGTDPGHDAADELVPEAAA